MIRLIIIGAIFYAGYQVGMNGYEEFISSINLENIGNSISNLFARMDNIISNLKG
jgi:hypothetical protein|tara:strand:+ start:213 stop:377 length:165 start_codon:yes stop_codon:yes gene_type:complete